MELRELIPLEFGSYLEDILGHDNVLYRASQHLTGVTLYAMSNVVLKKWRHLFDMLILNMSQGKKSSLLYAPISSLMRK